MSKIIKAGQTAVNKPGIGQQFTYGACGCIFETEATDPVRSVHLKDENRDRLSAHCPQCRLSVSKTIPRQEKPEAQGGFYV